MDQVGWFDGNDRSPDVPRGLHVVGWTSDGESMVASRPDTHLPRVSAWKGLPFVLPDNPILPPVQERQSVTQWFLGNLATWNIHENDIPLKCGT